MADFSDFQLKEYENISQAHFKTNEMMVAFFRYYLLIMALPITFLGTAFATAEQSSKGALLYHWQIPIGAFLVTIAGLGFLLMCYLSGLRLEAALYARTVNGVRAYFMKEAPAGTNHVLPIDVNKPKLVKLGDHAFIVLSFALFNTLYLVSAYSIIFVKAEPNGEQYNLIWPNCMLWIVGIIAVSSLITHLLAHHFRCRRMEKDWRPEQTTASSGTT